MTPITPSFIMDLESRMRHIQETEYLQLSTNLWWTKLTKVLPTLGRREIVTWVVNSAQLESNDPGSIGFDDMSIVETEFVPGNAAKGLKLRRQQLADLDGNGVQLASEWAAQMGAQFAYWPQKQVANMIKLGAAAGSLGYDKVPFFSASHPVNPNDTSKGTFSNLFTGVPIDVSVSADTALGNLQTVFAKIASIQMPNGSDPRFLRPVGILACPKLFPRAVQITNAKFLAQAASSGGGSGDVEALIASMAYGQPIMADEFAGFESDTTYFVIAKQITQTQLGGLVYIEREPFSTRYYTGRGGGNGVDAILDRSDILEWHASGRNGTGYGHPFSIFKCTP